MPKREIPAKLNVCLVASKFPILGRAADHGFLWPLARALARRGHQVTILSWTNPDHAQQINQDGITAYFLGEGRRAPSTDFPRLALQKFREIHSRQPFHVVHSVDAGGLDIGKLKRELQIAMVYDVEATQMSQIFAILGMTQETLGSLVSTGINVAYKFLRTFFGRDRTLLKTADAIFVTSPAQELALERYYLFPSRKTHVVPYGVEIGDLSPREKSDELRLKLNLSEGSQVVGTVTDMTSVEEMRHLFKAFAKIAVKRSRARLLVVGMGPKFSEVEYEALMLALGSRVIFTGAVPSAQLPDYISLADIFVNLSARTSGFEPSLIEAMAQKKVIIGSEVSPMANLVEDGLDGFLIRPADTKSLSELFHAVFHGDLDHVAIGERARAKVIQLFDLERMVRMTLDAYFQAMSDCRSFKRMRSAPWLKPEPSSGLKPSTAP